MILPYLAEWGTYLRRQADERLLAGLGWLNRRQRVIRAVQRLNTGRTYRLNIGQPDRVAILLVGCGGTGSYCAHILAQLAAWDDRLRTASVQIIATDGAALRLEAYLHLPPGQVRRLADHFVAAGQGQTGPKKSEAVIYFNRTGGPYGFLSNFARTPIRLGGQIWPTVEHYYQAQKFAGTEHEQLIRLAASPALAAHLGRDRTRPLRPDWPDVRLEVMREALRAKFSQRRSLREQLLATGSARLVERTRRDAYWGDGGDGHGQNHLGRLLMQLRDQLRKEAADDPAAQPGI